MIRRETPQDRYAKKALITKTIRFNKNTEPGLIAHIDTIENFTGYIKGLIRADIEKEHAVPDTGLGSSQD